MTDYDAGYLRALKDVQIAVSQMISDPSALAKGKDDRLDVVSLLDDLIRMREGRQGTPDADDAPDPLSGSF